MEEAFNKLQEKFQSILEYIILLTPNFAISLLVVFIGFFLVHIIQRRLEKILGKYLSNYSMAIVMSKVVAFFLSIGLLFIVLGILQLDKLLTSLLATAGVLGLAIGLALQEPLTNAFSGIMLLVKKRLHIGDVIESIDHFGIVTEINLRSTVLHTPAGQVVTIPNRSVIQNPIINYSYLGKRRIELDCGISYTENLDYVEEVVRKALIDMELLESEKIEFFYTEFGESSINFRIRFWSNQVNQTAYLYHKSEALRKIKRAFDNHNITIPFPIRTIDFALKGPAASEISE